ncbi:TPA: hypothetical protein N0F65_001625 [Lagenidium giganteum]|uniref:Uncharacterized protein n=1 Tax=Lagenidium giganteum TaxID=4803 RepID=A0AAV2YL09_9STRA|nr:TPA: hypothetical protein N0F65_001625 [Lagenidium giganteum]
MDVADVHKMLNDQQDGLLKMMEEYKLRQRGMMQMIIDDVGIKQREMLDAIVEHVSGQQHELVREVSASVQAARPDIIEEVINETLLDELVEWIGNDTKREDAKYWLNGMKQHLRDKHGNYFRSDFDHLLEICMDAMDIPQSRGRLLGVRVQEFKIFLTNDFIDDAARNRLMWGCYGILNVGNARSHVSGLLSMHEQLQLCASVTALVECFPVLVQKTKEIARAKEREAEREAAADAEAAKARAAAEAARPPAWTSGSAFPPLEPSSAPSPLKAPVTPPTRSSQTRSSPPPGFSPPEKSPPPGLAIVKQNPESPPQSMEVRSTAAPRVVLPELRFYHDRPTSLPKETDRTKITIFMRMLNHMQKVPKANLCHRLAAHDNCAMSHSYMEVMTYNPCFKRLICRQESHYFSYNVEERHECVCIHVDTGLTWEWMDDLHQKRSLCPRGSRCRINRCLKSHSFEEVCWYNPAFKTRQCCVRAHQHYTEPPNDCPYYHETTGPNKDQRDYIYESDYVGRPVPMLFPERSHKPLADILDAMRRQNE